MQAISRGGILAATLDPTVHEESRETVRLASKVLEVIALDIFAIMDGIREFSFNYLFL